MGALSIPPQTDDGAEFEIELERRGYGVTRAPSCLPVGKMVTDDAEFSGAAACARCGSDWGPFHPTAAGHYCADCLED